MQYAEILEEMTELPSSDGTVAMTIGQKRCKSF